MKTRRTIVLGTMTCLLILALAFSWIDPVKAAALKPPAKPAAPELPRSSVAPLTPEICPVLGSFSGSVGVYAKNLKTKKALTYNPDGIFASASTIKVPVAVIIYRYFYDQADADTRRFYDTGIERMMTVSDNEYFHSFLDEIEEKLGSDVVWQHFAWMGMKHTTIRDNEARNKFGYSSVTTARDMAIFFEHFYRGNLIRKAKTEMMKKALANTIFNEELPRYMQKRRVFHKIGELDDVLADVGVVEGSHGPVLISIYTRTPQNVEQASDFIAALSACVYNRLSGEPTAYRGSK